MISVTERVKAADPLDSLTFGSSNSTAAATSFARQLASAVQEDPKRSGVATPAERDMSEVLGRDSGGSQFLAAVRPATLTPAATVASGSVLAPATTPIVAALSGSATLPATATTTPASDIPTMLGMGPVAGTAPVQQNLNPPAVAATTAPISEADAYWNAQPAAVQVLRNMPDDAAKDKLALSLANQGYSIDTQIMVWGWDPQMTMTVRENQGYSWVPSFGQANIPVGPGLSMPDDPTTYNPGDPPAGAIQVSTAFAVGTIQNPLVQTSTT